MANLKSIAKEHSGRAKCTDCPIYKRNNTFCANEYFLLVCDYAYSKGFVKGYNYYKKNKVKK